jgi:hypothetical protein
VPADPHTGCRCETTAPSTSAWTAISGGSRTRRNSWGAQPERVDDGDADGQRRVVQGDDRRGVGVVGEAIGQPLDVQLTVAAARDRRVADDEPQAADRVLDRLRVAAADVELGAQGGAVVVVAGQHVHGRVQRREALAHAGVLGRVAVLGEVAGDDDRVGRLGQRADALDGRAQQRVVVGLLAEVQVADVREDHRGDRDRRRAGRARGDMASC